ncbi:flavodoxin family protein [Massilia dura]|uniref:Flavodoxin family protein n=1 Tax=Pseudoduganella dura TaxID=321982 RepID=A0A6I3XE69_9BURK|nr:NAD(P)H-dependent oxidoreductase [Pseudoduganella dura]MUI14759.1 flavodoxin family protein [Pseudoduganella dura]GGX98239.1 NAD(P)H dehydrogenase [Pseudoduganella dura]
MPKKVLLVHAHPEPTSVSSQLLAATRETLEAQEHEVMLSDLYAMEWKAVFDEHDFLHRLDRTRLSFIAESGHAYRNGTQAPDVQSEQEKLLAADAVVFQFPLWWFGMPAIMKGWFDRVFAYGLAYGYRDAGNRYRYGEGALQGKRAMLSVAVGGPEEDYCVRGINGPLDQLLFPVTHGTLFFAGMDVLPIHAVYGAARMTEEGMARATAELQSRTRNLFSERPIPFRRQNGGDYPDGHVLAEHVAPGLAGFDAHLGEPPARAIAL